MAFSLPQICSITGVNASQLLILLQKEDKFKLPSVDENSINIPPSWAATLKRHNSRPCHSRTQRRHCLFPKQYFESQHGHHLCHQSLQSLTNSSKDNSQCQTMRFSSDLYHNTCTQQVHQNVRKLQKQVHECTFSVVTDITIRYTESTKGLSNKDTR